MVACNADRPQVVYIRDRMTKKERNEKKKRLQQNNIYKLYRDLKLSTGQLSDSTGRMIMPCHSRVYTKY